MLAHVVVDFQFIYYKYKFTLISGRLKALSKNGEPAFVNGEITPSAKDVSMRYYCIKEIEGFRRKWESEYGEGNVYVTVCFDSKSARSTDSGYKSGRTKSLSDDDFKIIDGIRQMLEAAGHTCVKIDGCEADDLVANAAGSYSQFDKTIIYSIDKDILVNVSDEKRIIVMRYKQKKGYIEYNERNIENLLEEEFKTWIPYGMLPLYLCTVGDKSDSIKGIKGFGDKAFCRLLNRILGMVKDTSAFNDYDNTELLIKRIAPLIGQSEAEQALDSLALVRSLKVDADIKLQHSTREKREKAYGGEYEFKSLYA